MDLFDAIAQRYSYRRQFTDAPVPREDLKKIVAAGIRAPSACNEQVVSFVIVDDPSLLGQIAEIMGKTVCHSAHAMIACVADPRPVYGNESFAAEDCAASVENILLAITAMGYASVWLDGVLRAENRAARIGRILDVPDGHTVRILLPIGLPTEPGQPKERLPFERRAWFNQYREKSP